MIGHRAHRALQRGVHSIQHIGGRHAVAAARQHGDHHFAGAGRDRRGIGHIAVRGAGVIDIGQLRPGHAEAVRGQLDALAVGGVGLHHGGGIRGGRRYRQARHVHQRAQVIKVGVLGKRQQHAFGGIVARLRQHQFVIAVRFQQLERRIAFHQRGEGGIGGKEAGELAREALGKSGLRHCDRGLQNRQVDGGGRGDGTDHGPAIGSRPPLIHPCAL